MTQIILNGLFVGSFYALVALGYSMVYGVIKLLNFAHGDVYMLGAFVGLVLLTSFPGLGAAATIPVLMMVLVVSMLASGLVGVGIERVAYRPLRSAPRLSVLITAVGASFTLEYGIRQIFGPSPQAYPLRITGTPVAIFDAQLSTAHLILMIVAALLMAALGLYVDRTREGRAMRAIALDQRASTLMGIDVNRTISRVFFIGSALAGAGGVMAGAFYGSVDFLMGFTIGLKAFTAAVIGGIGSLYGAMIGGLILGLLESFGTAWVGGEWRDVFSFACLILFLSFRPTGVLGTRVVERM